MTSTLTLPNLASILNLSQSAKVGDIYYPYLDVSIWNLQHDCSEKYAINSTLIIIITTCY